MEELKQYLITNKITSEKLQAETRDIENRALPKRDLFVKLRAKLYEDIVAMYLRRVL